MERYAYSRCMTCGCCLEACPQYDEDHYIGPQAIAQVRLFNMHPSGAMNRDERLEAIMGEDGITNCGNAHYRSPKVKLRAERAGTGTGRVYTITVRCTDQYGNHTFRTTTVTVPHNQ